MSYLGRTVRTVQRWEREQKLPVTRHLHGTQSTVYASSLELDAWLAARAPDGMLTASAVADLRVRNVAYPSL